MRRCTSPRMRFETARGRSVRYGPWEKKGSGTVSIQTVVLLGDPLNRCRTPSERLRDYRRKPLRFERLYDAWLLERFPRDTIGCRPDSSQKLSTPSVTGTLGLCKQGGRSDKAPREIGYRSPHEPKGSVDRYLPALTPGRQLTIIPGSGGLLKYVRAYGELALGVAARPVDKEVIFLYTRGASAWGLPLSR
jgi:hypothetical protein